MVYFSEVSVLSLNGSFGTDTSMTLMHVESRQRYVAICLITSSDQPGLPQLV